MARKILLADDSVTAQNMGRKILADAGYEVVTVNNGSAALKKIAELKPDLVILDVYMPGYSGLEVCLRLKESQDSARIPVLLTVGKLEPFKPEEAQRVRAEGFIVKPFEASELLSALSKLEDKVVPRAESSKPGRFARAMASVEEASRGGRDPSISGEDNGWKSRIGFPQQKQKTEPEEKPADEAAIYNPVNRDLRTVVETVAEKKDVAKKEEAKKDEAKKEENRPQAVAAATSVDLAALAPAGLPHDVTPEEVAAIAAAAAQIRTLQASGANDDGQVSTTASPEPSLAQNVVQDRVDVSASADSAPLVSADATPHPNPVNIDHASQQPVQAVTPELYPVAQNRVAQGQDTQAQNVQDKDAQDKDAQDKDARDKDAQDVPVTMAAANPEAAVAGSASRWTAVSVALAAEESTISLDQEMQRAYATFVAEETATVEINAQPEPASQNSSAPTATVVEEIPVAAISNPDPEPAVAPRAQETEPAPAVPPQAAVASSAPTPASFSEPASSVPQPEPEFSAPVPTDVVPAESHAVPAPPQFNEPIPEPVAQSVSKIAEPASTPEPAVIEAASSVSPEEPKQEESKKEDHKEETITVKSTAAAWANWRQIRDTGDAKADTPQPAHPEFDTPVSQPAVMAAAAGAEQIPQNTDIPIPPTETPTDVSSIVDSVLADLRPRLMAEISRKMAEKK